VDVVIGATGEVAEVPFQDLVDRLAAALSAAVGEDR
jgi:hypothetical protein